MKLIEFAIRKPVSVTVGVLLAAIWSLLALGRLPIQILPTIDRPVITVSTDYYGASPFEIESELTNPIEEHLAAVENVRRMTSRSSDDRSTISLEFDWGVDKDLAMIDIVKKLNQVRNLPRDAREPTVSAVTSEEVTPVMWLGLTSQTKSPNQTRLLAEEYIQPRLERVGGVGRVRVFGGQEREIRVVLDHDEMNGLDLTVADVRRAIDDENRNVKGGYIDEGKTRYTVRTVGQFDDIQQLESIVIKQENASYVRLGDIARVEDSFKRQNSEVKMSGHPVCAIPVYKKTGSNTLEVVESVEATVADLNAELQYKDVQLVTIYKASDYIYASLKEVRTNLLYGALLAALVLLLFLRNWRSTLILTVTIPISLLSSFLVLYAMGRTLNIITLAGLSFAAGMVVDNAIVVLENIFRHIQELGKSRFRACLDATQEVWSAMLASSLTTLSVFVPIIFIQEEAGQIFKDIAIAISAAIVFSLLAALTVIPMLSNRYLRVKTSTGERRDDASERGTREPGNADSPTRDPLRRLGGRFSGAFESLLDRLLAGVWRKILFVAFVAVVFVLSLFAAPPAEYLPSGHRNFIFGVMQTPPGFNLQQKRELLAMAEASFEKHPEIEHYFSVARPGDSFLGGRLHKKDEDRAQEVLQEIQADMHRIPGARVFIAQAGLFQRGFGGKSVDVTVMGRSFEELQTIAERITEKVQQVPGVSQIRSSFELGNPEMQVHVDREAAAAVGLSTREVADAVETLVAGTLASIYRDGGQEYDITLVAPIEEFQNTSDLSRIRIQTAGGEAVKLSSVASVVPATGPTRIDHTEQERSITLNCFLTDEVTVGSFIETLNKEILPDIRADLPRAYTIDLTGSASDLQRTFDALSGSFLLAVVIVYLLMSALYESFIHPLVIMVSIPMAASGGFFGVRLSGTEFNVITMLGFIILAGIVVNNGILVVDRTLQIMRLEGRPAHEAIRTATSQRLRPILMTTVTTILGILPLTISRGAGAEVYNGLGAAIVGGLAISSLFTLLLIPVLLSLLHDLIDRFDRRVETSRAA